MFMLLRSSKPYFISTFWSSGMFHLGQSMHPVGAVGHVVHSGASRA
jgi:hypothetical protein